MKVLDDMIRRSIDLTKQIESKKTRSERTNLILDRDELDKKIENKRKELKLDNFLQR